MSTAVSPPSGMASAGVRASNSRVFDGRLPEVADFGVDVRGRVEDAAGPAGVFEHYLEGGPSPSKAGPSRSSGWRRGSRMRYVVVS